MNTGENVMRKRRKVSRLEVTVTMLPIICLYPFLQRYFVTGLTIGGVKE